MIAAMDTAGCGMLSLYWTEMSVLICFFLGFALLRGRQPGGSPATHGKGPAAGEATTAVRAAVAAEASAGNYEVAVKLWRVSQAYVPSDIRMLELVARALFETDPVAMVDEVVQHMALHAKLLSHPAAVVAVLQVPARAGDAALMEELLAEMEDQLQIEVDHQVDEVVLEGYASAASPQGLSDYLQRIRASGRKVTVRCRSLAMRALLQQRLPLAAVDQALDMQRDGFAVPPAAMTELIRVACNAGLASQVFAKLRSELRLTPDAVELLVENAARHSQLDLANDVRKYVEETKVPLTLSAQNALLKIHSKA